MQISLLQLSLTSIVLASLSACSVVSPGKPDERRLSVSSVSQEEPSPEAARPMPWEIWPHFKTLAGQPLTSRDLLYGDELRESGKNNSALDTYLKAKSQGLSPEEMESVALRISGQYLVLDKPTKALREVGAYCRKSGVTEADVSPQFGLLLAYGFGREGDVNQSLAWFSRVHSQGATMPGASGVARQGATLLLQSLPTEKFETIAAKWHGDEFVNALVGQERARRSQVGWLEPDSRSAVPFWALYSSVSVAERDLAPVSSDEARVGVILSLTKYGSVGSEMKRGIELAAAAQTELPRVRLEIRDVGTEAADSSAVIRELAGSQKIAALLGPLGVPAATTARDVGLPLLSLSKTEPFAVGGGVFRLGVTTTSQVDALVNSAYGEHKLTRFAVVHPQTANGQEFLEAFRTKLGALNLRLVLEVAYTTSDEVSMLEAAQRLESSQAEAVLIPDTVEVTVRVLSSLSPEARKRIRVLGTSAWDSPDKIAHSQALFDGAIFVAPFFKNSTRREVQDFIASYRGKFNASPSVHSAQGFDAETLINNALKVSRARGVPLPQAMQLLPQYDGVTGVIAAGGGSGEIERALYVVEVGASSFQEKLPPQQVPRFEETFTANQDQVSGLSGEEAPLEADQKVSSGY